MSRFYLVRHGQASFGNRDYDQLSPLGIEQSQMLGRWLASTGLKPQQILHGSMVRQQQTAKHCLEHWIPDKSAAISPTEHLAFNEFDHKEVLLRSYPQFSEPGYLERFIAEQPDSRRSFHKKFAESMQRWIAGNSPHEYTETWPEFRQRCVHGMLQVAEKATDQDVWIFTSGGPIAAIMQYVMAIPDEKVLEINWAIRNASISLFTCRSGTIRLKQFNSVAHLIQAHRPELLTYR
jgi:broad specificity phosphatase PhoE